MTNKKVAEVFAKQTKTEGHACNIFFNGKTIYSFGYHFPVAILQENKVALFTSLDYSRTTSKHKYIIHSALQAEGWKVITVPDVRKPEAEDNLKYYPAEIAVAEDKARRARKEYSRNYWTERISILKSGFYDYQNLINGA